ncbi:hypothetical protein [Halothiobacillus sp. 15-55-196]|uniref:hypothetical protein n=1 Tax=Halothiobacillus sp. 15-55-196 TaxID=1970382 RepID=UPI0025BB6103|nr:hypothetical protein [Halothiobacillus sp. 15-55-196]
MKSITEPMPRRRFLQSVGFVAGATMLPAAFSARVFAEENLVIAGPKVPDIKPTRLAEHVFCIVSPWGFPSAENQGMMSNVTFVNTEKGVIIIDSGASRQIGEMALRQIRQLTQCLFMRMRKPSRPSRPGKVSSGAT